MGAFEDDYEFAAAELLANHGYLGRLGGLGVGRALAYLPRILMDGEKVFFLTRGSIGCRPWLLAVTDLRVIFLNQGYIFGYKLLEIPLSSVKMVFYRLGLFFGEIVFSCGETQTRLSGVGKANLPTMMTLLAEALNGTSAPIDKLKDKQAERLSQLERLATLKAKGALTDAEFAAQKKMILSGRS
ncbi:MAG: PH domain-containing protein [Deltaproteobacteria bacterium]|jgi:hypothetical protein|nr:PH domain-containing protein [Deltaproteobacteria bacterium]